MKTEIRRPRLAALVVAGITAWAGSNADAATLTVDPAGGAGYTTIEAAVAAAQPGDTIECAAGNYAPHVTINKSITLKGAQSGVDARSGRPGAAESVITSGGLGVFVLNAAGITFDGFTFSNLRGRTLDTYFNADNFAMRNCILAGNVGTYVGGGIQFGGGTNLHANGFVFEQNLVTADNGYLLYLGHAMDNGTVRDNKFNGDSVSFGPFGSRTGWLIEGNEFDGNATGHGAYWGYGFNANLGDVLIQKNNVHQMTAGIGQISVVGGAIVDNEFTDNKSGAFQLWGGEWGSVVSDDVTIERNTISYKAANGDGFLLRPKDSDVGLIDAARIHVHGNRIVKADAAAGGYAIRNQARAGTALDASCNWWGTNDAAAIAGMMDPIGWSTVSFSPWLLAPGPEGSCIGGTPRGIIIVVVQTLSALIPTGDASTDQKIAAAVSDLQASLATNLWQDSNNLTAAGDKVFQEALGAVASLELITNPPSEVLKAIQQIVAAAKALAGNALDAAIAANGDPKKIAEAKKAMLHAADAWASGQADTAISGYMSAWKKAMDALT